MPTRILRDWTDSEVVNQLSAQGERTFVRVIMKADDYGRLTCNLKLLRPLLYPLLLDQVREADLQRWISECETAGLVRLYSVEGKQYLTVVKFGQRLRRTRAKYPDPSLADPPQVAASCGKSPPEVDSDSEADSDSDEKITTERRRAPPFKKPTEQEVAEYAKSIGFLLEASRFLDFYDSNGWRVGRNQMRDWRAAVRTWKRNQGENYGKSQNSRSVGIPGHIAGGATPAADGPRIID